MSEVSPKNLKVGNVYKVKEGKREYTVKITKNNDTGDSLEIEGTQLDQNDNETDRMLQTMYALNLEPGETQDFRYKFYEIAENPSGGRKKRKSTLRKRKTRSKSRRRRV